MIRLACALACLLAGPIGAARAQGSEVSASAAAAARDLYEAGIEAAEAERFEEALEAFERSYELAPRAATLMNLGAVAEPAGRLVTALNAYRRFLASADERLLAAHGAAARAAIARLTPALAHLSVVVVGLERQDELRLDGAPLERASLGLDLPVDPGPHAVTVERTVGAADGARSEEAAAPERIECARADVTLSAGARRDLELRVACPLPRFVVEAAVTAPAPADPAPWIALGVGAGVLVIGAVVVGVVVASAPPPSEPGFVGNLAPGSFVVF
jgi:tetratricopeptide (TPR) repeat protein